MILEKAFNLQTFINSETAKELNIDNNPTDEHFINLTHLHRLLLEVQERLCVKFAKPIQIKITSGYRSQAVNDELARQGHKVSKSSQHLKGQAADTNAIGIPLNDYFGALQELAKSNTIKFGQVIKEQINGREWIHISTPTDKLVNDFKYTTDGINYIKVKL